MSQGFAADCDDGSHNGGLLNEDWWILGVT